MSFTVQEKCIAQERRRRNRRSFKIYYCVIFKIDTQFASVAIIINQKSTFSPLEQRFDRNMLFQIVQILKNFISFDTYQEIRYTREHCKWTWVLCRYSFGECTSQRQPELTACGCKRLRRLTLGDLLQFYVSPLLWIYINFILWSNFTTPKHVAWTICVVS